MHKLKTRLKKLAASVMAASMALSMMAVSASAEESTLSAGTYDVDATLSCYVNAMGGVEFSDGYGLLTGSSVTVAADGSATATIKLGTTSGLSIYGVACTAFIGTDEAPGVYVNGSVSTTGVTYTTSTDTAANANGQVNYIDSITFPVDQTTSEYTMWLYLDSNVMGCQLGDGSGSGSSNTPGVATAHTAKLTIDWTSVETDSDAPDTDTDTDDSVAGTYVADTTLSCYVNAMGGVEFSDGYGLLSASYITKDEDGNAKITLKLGTTSGLTIYGVACTAFIGTDEEPGIYVDGEVSTEDVIYTVSENKVANADGEVNYIDSITFPVDENTEEYTLWLYLDSNVMGCQLGDGSGTGSSNTPGVATAHTATLTIDWDTLEEGAGLVDTLTASSTVEYTVEGVYEVEIPATIKVDSKTKIGSYDVTAVSLPEGGYMTVSAATAGTLTNGNATVNFTNALAGDDLTFEGDLVRGTVTVTGKASSVGKYTGTLNFTINCY